MIAGSPNPRLRALWVSLFVALAPWTSARAQQGEAHEEAPEPVDQVVRVAGTPLFPGRAELWARRVARALRRSGARVEAPETIGWDAAGIEERRLAELAEIEAALGMARRAQVALEEAQALRALASASQRARALLDVPGAAAWLAEIEAMTAIVAAQRGDEVLVEASLRRALALAPDRALQEGEAPPELVARSGALMREDVRRARLEVRVLGTAADPGAAAQVFVDDRPIGALPRELELPAGLHVVRIEARGHRPYARLVDLAPGSRPPMVVALSPSAPAREAETLERAVAGGAPEDVARALDAIVAQGGVPRSVWLVYVGTGALDRSAIVRCRPGACDAPRRADDGSVLTLDATSELGAGEGSLSDALAWIDESPIAPSPPEPPLLESWWLWAGIGAVAVGVGVGIGLAAAPPGGEAPLVLRIDPCTSCGR
jgi:hypothetical protein